RPDPRPALRPPPLRAGAEQPLAGLAADVEQAPVTVRAEVADALAQLIGEDSPAYRLTRSQVRELARAGFEIGFHTRDHRPLPELTDDELARALGGGRAAREEATGHRLHGLAYPHGSADERVAAAARSAGYADGFGGPDRSITARADRLVVRRVELVRGDPSAV